MVLKGKIFALSVPVCFASQQIEPRGVINYTSGPHWDGGNQGMNRGCLLTGRMTLAMF